MQFDLISFFHLASNQLYKKHMATLLQLDKEQFLCSTEGGITGALLSILSSSGVLWEVIGGMLQIYTLFESRDWNGSRFSHSFPFVRGMTGAEGVLWIASLGHPKGFVKVLQIKCLRGGRGQLQQQLMEKQDICSLLNLLLRGREGWFLKHLRVFQMGNFGTISCIPS